MGGFELRRRTPFQSAFKTYGGNQWDFTNVKRLGLEPDLVVDIGVAKGTPELYAAFPDCELFLIEPIAEFNDAIGQLLSNRSHRIVNKAVGKSSEELKLHWNQERPAQTSLYQRTMHTGRTRTIKVEPLDQILCDVRAENVIIKIDAEGAELDVLEGAVESLQRSIAVFVEVNMGFGFEEYRNSLPEVNRLLSSAGFNLHSIMDAVRKGNDYGLSIQKADLFYLRVGPEGRDQSKNSS